MWWSFLVAAWQYYLQYLFTIINFIDVIMKLNNYYYLPLAESQRRVTDTDQANPQFNKLNKSQTLMYSDDKLEKNVLGVP